MQMRLLREADEKGKGTGESSIRKFMDLVPVQGSQERAQLGTGTPSLIGSQSAGYSVGC